MFAPPSYRPIARSRPFECIEHIEREIAATEAEGDVISRARAIAVRHKAVA